MQKRGSKLRLFPLALYAGLPAASQQQVFEPTPRGYRKVDHPYSPPPIPILWAIIPYSCPKDSTAWCVIPQVQKHLLMSNAEIMGLGMICKHMLMSKMQNLGSVQKTLICSNEIYSSFQPSAGDCSDQYCRDIPHAGWSGVCTGLLLLKAVPIQPHHRSFHTLATLQSLIVTWYQLISIESHALKSQSLCTSSSPIV